MASKKIEFFNNERNDYEFLNYKKKKTFRNRIMSWLIFQPKRVKLEFCSD